MLTLNGTLKSFFERKSSFRVVKLQYAHSRFKSNVCSEEKVKEKNLMKFEDIPGPKSYPVIGTLYKYLPIIGDYDAEALHEIASLNWRRYGSLVRENPGVRMLHIYDPDDIEYVFRQDGRYPARRSHIAMMHYRLNKVEFYNTGGLLSTNGPEWWRIRSTFQKNFTSPQSVKSHVRTTDYITREFIDWIKSKEVSYVDDFLPYLNRLNLEIIGMVAFNERFNSFSENEQKMDSRSSRVIDAAFNSNSGIMKLDKGIWWRYFKTPLYRKLEKSQEYLEKVSKDILSRKINFFEGSNVESDSSLLSSFLQMSNCDVKDILTMMVDILMASIDTTAYTTSFLLHHLAVNKECQTKLYEEISALMPNEDTVVTSHIISKAVYMRSCVKETLRLNPVSIGVGRVLQKDLALKGYLIPKDTVIVTQNMLASRLPQYVRDPLKFKPERWLRGDANYEDIHPFLSLPFGFGTRSCIARRLAEQNIHIVILKMLREFEITWKGGDLGIKTFLINKPDKPISLYLKKRKN